MTGKMSKPLLCAFYNKAAVKIDTDMHPDIQKCSKCSVVK